jgi:hypothetical protein
MHDLDFEIESGLVVTRAFTVAQVTTRTVIGFNASPPDPRTRHRRHTYGIDWAIRAHSLR